MVKRSKVRLHYSLTGAIAVFALIVMTLVVSVGIRTLVSNFAEQTLISYSTHEQLLFDTILEDAIDVGKVNLLDASESIQEEINATMDLEQLESDLETNSPNDQFDSILRKYLMSNSYIDEGMDENRNSIFVLVNNNLVANYSHDKVGNNTTDYALGEENSENIYHIIEESFYNVELSTQAIDDINDQKMTDYVIWQERSPSLVSDIPMYSRMTINDIHDIFDNYGVNGFSSFEFLIPVYITNHGNLFGEYDSTTSLVDNKIIIVQRLNLTDYINECHPEAFSESQGTSTLYDNYKSSESVLNIFIIIECIAMFVYAITFINVYNNGVLARRLEELEESLTGEEDKNESE